MKVVTQAIAPIQGFRRPPVLSIIIVDNSGSMGWAIDKLKQEVKSRLRDLPEGDGILVGWFSGRRDFQWITSEILFREEHYDLASKSIDKGFRARGLTCFSDILTDVPNQLQKFANHFQVVNLTFMSDGYPTVGHQDIVDSLAKCEQLKPLLCSSAVVAYGDYADRSLLSSMATLLGGEFVSTNSVEEVMQPQKKFSAGKAIRKRKVKLDKPANGRVFAYSTDEGQVTVLTLQEGETEFEIPETLSVASFDEVLPDHFQTEQDLVLGYIGVLGMLRGGQTDQAVDLLSKIGDVHLVHLLGNALSNAELAHVEQEILGCVTDPGKRFSSGRKPGCAPDPDAFDLMNLLDVLISDPECKFNPNHDLFRKFYRKIGRSSKSKIDIKFHPVEDESKQWISLYHVSGHAEELNLSILTHTEGHIDLPDKVTVGGKELKTAELFESPQFPTKIYRNYALVADGKLQVRFLPCKLSAKAHQILVTNGLVQEGLFNPEELYIIDLAMIPICNRNRGQEACNWPKMAELAVESLRLGAIIKVLKAKRTELDPNRELARPLNYTPDQSELLESCGIRLGDGSFSPPQEMEEATDVLEVRVFKIKIAKSSPVSMNDFKLMLEGKKNWNEMGKLMAVGQDLIQRNMPNTKGEAVAWLTSTIDDLLHQQRSIDFKLNAMRFAVTVSGRWLQNHKEDEYSLQHGGWNVTLVCGKKQKAI